jgi:hypothetical protein
MRPAQVVRAQSRAKAPTALNLDAERFILLQVYLATNPEHDCTNQGIGAVRGFHTAGRQVGFPFKLLAPF